MRKTIYAGRDIGAYDVQVTVPDEFCPASMAYNRYFDDFSSNPEDRLSFHVKATLETLDAKKVKDDFYWIDDKNVAILFLTNLRNFNLGLFGSESNIGELEEILSEQIEQHRERNRKRVDDKNQELEKKGLRNTYYQTNEKV